MVRAVGISHKMLKPHLRRAVCGEDVSCRQLGLVDDGPSRK